MNPSQIKRVTPFTIGDSAQANGNSGNSTAGSTNSSDPNAALPAGAPPPELMEAEQARTTAEMELNATKNEAAQKDRLSREQVALSTAIRPVQRQTEHQIEKVTELRDRIKGDTRKPRGRVFALDKIAGVLEKLAVDNPYQPSESVVASTKPPRFNPKTPAYTPPAIPSYSGYEPTPQNNREMALDEADSIYGDQLTPVTSGTGWAMRGIQGRQQRRNELKTSIGVSPDTPTFGDTWNRWMLDPWQYAAGQVADFGQNLWHGAGKNVGANHMAAKAGLRGMYDQAVAGAAASKSPNWAGKLWDGIGNLQWNDLSNYTGDTLRTVANVTPFGLGMFQDPRQRERDAAAEGALKAQEASAEAQAQAQSNIVPAVPSGTPTNFGDLVQAILPFLGMGNQFGGYDGYGGNRPDHSGNFVELMRVLGNMQREPLK